MNKPNDSYAEKRELMVASQLISRGINDPAVLKAMRKVPRHEFVPDDEKDIAYNDYPLTIGEGQTISQPYIVALMTECLKLKSGDKILEIGTGSGYQSAVLAEIAGIVFSVEIIEKLAVNAENTLKSLGYNNITIKQADGYSGWSEYAPFNGIIVTCAPEEVPQYLICQLAEKGRLVIPVGRINEAQTLKVIEKNINGSYNSYDITGVRFVPMIS